MKIYILNAFSLSMYSRLDQTGTPLGYEPLSCDSPRVARMPVPLGNARGWMEDWVEAEAETEIISAVGHADTAAVFSAILGREVPVNRISVKLGPGSLGLVGQLVGPRLPEGATTLPEGATIEWWLV